MPGIIWTLMALGVRGAQKSGAPRRQRGWFAWWVAPSPTLLWRLPLLLSLAVFSAWFVFRGLVHMAFIFEANAVLSFIFAPVLLPLAALPALCFWFVMRRVPRVWADAESTPACKGFTTLFALPAALLVASFIDLLETIAILRMGIRLPRLPFDLF